MARRRTRSQEPKPTKEQIKGQAKDEGKRVSAYLKRHPWVLVGLLAVVLLCAVFYGIPPWQTAQPAATVSAESTAADVSREELTVHMIDVGQGDATLIRQGSATMLIDAGVTEQGDTVIAYLRSLGVERLDLVLATHAHADHVGGITRVLKAFPVKTFLIRYLPEGVTPTTTTYERMLNTLAKQNVTVKEAAVGDTYRLGDATVRILAPTRDFEEINNQSVVCMVTYGQRRFLFEGDAEYLSENAVLASGQDVAADVIKVGHHGSSDATSWTYLQAVHPSIALISCGRDNDYGHPHQETLQKLKKQQIAVYRTDQSGTVVVHTDGQSLSVTTEK